MISAFSAYGIMYIAARSNNSEVEVASKNIEKNANVNVYIDVAEKSEDEKENNDNTTFPSDNKELEKAKQEDNLSNHDGIRITALGEIMMGSNSWANNSYSLAFKEISSYTQKSDYVVSTLATNITSVEDLSDTKTKYIANESIVNAFSALNIKALNIATDHMLDFSKNMFLTTINTLRKNNIDVIGLENDIAYAEHNGTRVAFIGVNNVIIGNSKNYIDAGMYVYDLGKIKNSIKEAKKNADTVVVMPHYGKENAHQVTDVMRWFARELINAGADIVLGSHSPGIYPVEEYNGKIIIYSLGYLMHDTNDEYGKKSAIFDFSINSDGSVQSIDITPTYIENKKTVKLYKDVNIIENKVFLEKLNSESKLDKYTSKIENDKLVINIKD